MLATQRVSDLHAAALLHVMDEVSSVSSDHGSGKVGPPVLQGTPAVGQWKLSVKYNVLTLTEVMRSAVRRSVSLKLLSGEGRGCSCSVVDAC